MVKKLRGLTAVALSPLASILVKLGVSANAVTLLGTIGVVVASVALLATGRLFWGAVAVGGFALFDALDGTMARLDASNSAKGEFLDSTLDRIADGAMFASLCYYFASIGHNVGLIAGLCCLVLAAVVPYARAKAAAIGVDAAVGIFERGDRMTLVLLATLAVGAGTPIWALSAALALTATLSLVTIGQRIAAVMDATA